MSIKNRLIIAFTIILFLFVSLGGIFIYFLNEKIMTFIDLTHDHPLVVSNTAREINGGIISIHRSMKDVVLSKNQKHLEENISAVNAMELNVLQNFNIVQERYLGDQGDVKNFKLDFIKWREIRGKVIDKVKEQKLSEAAHITQDQGAQYVQMLLTKSDKLLKFASNKAFEFRQKVKEAQTHILIIIKILILVFFILSYFIGKYTLKKIFIIENELNETRSQFESAIQHSPLPIMVHREDGKILFLSKAWEQNTGYTLNDILNIQLWKVSTYDKKEISLKKFLSQLHAKDETKYFDKLSFKNHLGVIRHWEVYSAPLNKKSESKRLIITTAVDITKRKKAEEEKDEIQKQLFQSSKLASIGELAAGIGHEINNPMAMINGCFIVLKSELENNNILNEKMKSYFNILDNASSRIVNIVQGLRTYSRANSDIIEILDLNQTIIDTLSFTGVIYEKQGITVKENLSDEHLFVEGNKGKLTQVFMNLISNAKDAVEKTESPLIIVNTYLKDDTIITEIIDNGEGIPSENKEKVFDTFFTTKDPGKGTGLGLSIVKNIIDVINGKIYIESKENNGTTIRVEIPQKHISFIKKQKNAPFSAKKIHSSILIVDDEEYIRNLLEKILEDMGLKVSLAEDGFTALKMLQNQKFDFILTDVRMPKMSGIEFVKKCRNIDGLKTKIICMTGSTSGEERELIDADHFLQKPFQVEEIYKCLI